MYYIALYTLMTFFDTALVSQLGSEDYDTRNKAEVILVHRGWLASPSLRRGLSSDDAEIRRACRTLIRASAYEGVNAEFGALPEIDSAWYDIEDKVYSPSGYPLNYYHLSPYLEITGYDDWPFLKYYEATHLWLETELQAGTDPEDLRPLLSYMRYHDRAFLDTISSPPLHHMPEAD